MERLVIINHETHQCFIEDVSEEDLAKYNGEEEAYIKDMYELTDNFSWDYVIDISYIDELGDPCDIEVKKS